MKRILALIAVALVLLAGVLLFNTVRESSRQILSANEARALLPPQRLAQKLSAAVRVATVSGVSPELSVATNFDAWRDFLATNFPLVHRSLHLQMVGEHSFLYHWAGSEGDRDPVLLAAHYDVVPVVPGNAAHWSHPPFAGVIDQGYVWGRGALDDKAGVVMIMEAVERLLQEGFRPRTTFYIALGHDEELGGRGGARNIAQLLRSRGIRLQLVMDEGMPVATNAFPGVTQPIALIGISQKGYLSVELVAEGPGGHSSSPPSRTSIGILSRSISRLEEHPMPARLTEPLRAMFGYIAPELALGQRLVFSNLWLFSPLVRAQLGRSPPGNAMIRTTMAPTLFSAGVKENVLAGHARAVVNIRMLPGDTADRAIRHIREIADDGRVQIRPLAPPIEPSPVSATDSRAFLTVQQSIEEVFPQALVAPALLIGGADARYYTALSQNVYRFRPIRMGTEDVRRFHGIDERLSLADLQRGLTFYYRLIRNAD